MKVYFPNDNSTVFIPCSSGDDGCSPAYDGPTAVTPGATDVVLPTRHTTVTQDITVIGDPDLIPANIVQNVDIFGVQGEAVIPSLGALSVTANGTYTAPQGTGYDEVDVAVPASAVDSGTKSITSNGNNQDVVGYAAVDVNVPNSYTAGDEGKVVSSGGLVSQTSATYTANDTYDTTLINSVTVNVSGGGGTDYLEARLNGTLTSYENDNVTMLYAQSFRSYPPLTSLKVHNVASIGNAAIYDCSGLTSLAFPKLSGSTTPGAMQNNTNLESLDFGPEGNWALPTISGNSKMAVLVLRRTSGIVPLSGINALNNTPFASGNAGGILYVPNALISTYQGATNWSTILGYANNSIQKIEGSYYETHYADGTVIS